MILIFFALIGVTAVAMRPLDLAFRKNMAEIRDNFIKIAENFTGRKLEYGSMSPSIFGSLDIRDLSLRRDDDSLFLTISRLRVSYSLWNLIRGNMIEGFRAVRIDRPVFSMDMSKDNDLFELFLSSDGADTQPNFWDYLPEDFQIRLRNGEWETRADLGYIRIRNFNLDGNIRNSRIVFNSRWNASGTLSGGQDFLGISASGSAPISASSSGRASGDFDLYLADGSGTISIPFLQGDLFRLEPLSFSVFLRNRQLEIRKTYDRTPVDIAMYWNMNDQNLLFTFSGEDFSPGNLITLTGSLRNYNSWTALKLSGRADLTVNDGDLNYVFDLNGALPPSLGLNVFFTLGANGDDKKIDFRNLYLDSASGNIRYTGSLVFSPLAPTGTLTVSNLVLAEGADPNRGIFGTLYIRSDGQETSIFGENIVSGPVMLSALDAVIFQEEEGLAFLLSALRLPDGSSSTDSAEALHASGLALEGFFNYESSRVEASLKLDSFSLLDIVDFLSPIVQVPVLPEIARGPMEDIAITTELFFALDDQHSLYNAPAVIFVYGDEQFAEFSLSGTDRRFELNQGTIFLADAGAGLSGYVDFSNPQDISFSVELTYRDLAYYARGVILDNQSVSLSGSYGLEGFFSGAGTRGYSGYIQGDHIPLPSGDQYAQLSFLVSLRYDSASFWSADIDRFEITGIALPSSDASLELTGWADQDGVLIPRILYNDGNGSLSGNLSMTWDALYRDYYLHLGLSGIGEQEYLRLNAFFNGDNALSLELSVQNLQLARFSRNITNGTASGSLSASFNSWESYQAELSLSSAVYQWQDQILRISASASLDNTELLLHDLGVFFGSELEALIPHLRLNLSEGRAETAAQIWGTAGGRPVNLSMQGEAKFNPFETWFDFNKITDSLYGSLVFDQAQYYTITAEEHFQFVFSSVKNENGQTLTLEGGPRNMVRLRYVPESGGGGNFYAALSAPSPIRGSFTGFIDSTTIDLRVPDLYADMGALWQFTPPQDIIAFPGGIAAGSLHITGPLQDPEFYGAVRATSFRISVPLYLPEEIRPIPVDITLEGNEMNFGPVFAAVGDGSGIVTAWFQFERWVPLIFSMDIDSSTEAALPVAFDINGVLTKGLVSGHLNLAMENRLFAVSGDLTAHNTEITLESSEMGAFGYNDRSGSRPTIVDIIVRSGRQVEFYWPSSDFPILHAQADQGSRIRINSDSGTRRFSLTGDVNLRSGEIFYLERNFYLRQGVLFFNENETRFEPRISARAEIRDQGDQGPVTISMIIDNAPLVSFSPRFESSPPMSQIQIYSLLGTGQTGTPDTSRDTNAILTFTADAIAQFTLMRTFERQIRNFLRLDMFSLRTRVLQNVIFQAAGIQANTGLGNYFDNTTVFLGKYLGPNIFLEALLSLKYDPAKQSWNGLTLEPEIGFEMRNPLFDIRMNMLLLHPETWFINDITISLIWRWSF
jgi:hypothetical protein